jgi:hypothetical protein
LVGRFRDVTRQHHIKIGKSMKPHRIDFRCGTTNPVVIEFAVRPPTGGGTLYGSQNRSELNKLCRVKKSTARLRVLLLIDLHSEPLDEVGLRATYKTIRSGPGAFARHSVRVLYVHRGCSFNFPWEP